MRRLHRTCIAIIVALGACDSGNAGPDAPVEAGSDADTGDGVIELPPATSQVRTRSPALEAGGVSGAGVDLRRLPRPDGSTTDIGIYEGL